MKKVNLSILASCFLIAVNGQTNKVVTGFAKASAGLQGIGFSYEPLLFNKFTLDVYAGAGGGYDVYEDLFEFHLSKPALHLSLTPKYFYNIGTRTGKGRNTQFNSANYFGIRIKYVTPFANQIDRSDGITTNALLTNIHWGLQRAINGHYWLFHSQAGIGYAQDGDCDFLECGSFYPALDLAFSYVLKKTKRKVIQTSARTGFDLK